MGLGFDLNLNEIPIIIARASYVPQHHKKVTKEQLNKVPIGLYWHVIAFIRSEYKINK